MDFFVLFFSVLIGFLILVVFGSWICAYILRAPFFSQKTRNMTARMGLRVINKGLRVKLTVTGREHLPEESFVVIANHVSNMDIIALCEAIPRPIAFVAKEELGKVPFLGAWMETMKCVFIKREDVRGSIKLINEVAAQQVIDGLPMVIFPEGTRSLSHDVAPFKGGSFSLVAKSQAPVVPITIENTYKVMSNFPRRTQVNITIHPAIYPTDYVEMNRNQLAEKVYEQVVSGFSHD
ncbi:MAG: lysophospholipid acyltransferase family protein [Culicoidibacterales bacterium]